MRSLEDALNENSRGHSLISSGEGRTTGQHRLSSKGHFGPIGRKAEDVTTIRL